MLLSALASVGAPTPAADITFRYSDFTCSAAPPKFRLPTFVNAPLGWTGSITAVSPCTWLVTRVPWSFTAVFNLGVCGGETAASKRIRVQVCVPPPGCASAQLDARWDEAASGSTCLLFRWDVGPRTRFRHFSYELIDSSGTAVAAGLLEPDESSLLITDLAPNAPFEFALAGVCADRSTHAATSIVPAVTFPAPYLGNAYAVVDCVPTEGSTDLCDLTVKYTEYYCATGFVATYANPPVGWTGSVTLLSSSPPVQWLVTRVPYSSVLALVITADVGDCVCPPAFERAGDSLRVTLTIDVASSLGGDCPTVGGGFGVTQLSSTSYTVTIGWSDLPTNSQFSGGYGYNLYDPNQYWPSQEAQAIISSYKTLQVTIDRDAFGDTLTCNTPYQFNIWGICGASPGTLVGLSVSTSADTPPCTPTLGPVAYSSTNPKFTTSTKPAGTYTATLAYTAYSCLDGLPKLTWKTIVPAPPLPPPAPILDNGNWLLTALPPGATATLEFSGTPAACSDGTIPNPVKVIFTVPSSYPGCTTQPLNVQVVPSPKCATATWTGSASFARGYTWTLKTGATTVYSGTSPPGASSQALPPPPPPFQSPPPPLTPSTAYVFTLTGNCTPTQMSPPVSVPFTTPALGVPTLEPFVQNASNLLFSYESNGIVMVTLFYSTALQTCVEKVRLAVAGVPTDDITNVNPQFTVKNLTQNTTYEFTISADAASTTGACGVCAPGSSAPTPISFSVFIPLPTPTPTHGAPFELVITNYGGPPSRLVDAGKLEADSMNAPALAGVNVNPPTSLPSVGSWASQHSMYETYSTNVVSGFIKYHTQTKRTVNGYTFYLPITQLFFGNAIDPTVQGASVPYLQSEKYGIYAAFLPYNYANSFYLEDGPADPSDPLPWPPTTPPVSFQFPPFLEYFRQLAVYNWELSNENAYPNKGAFVSMALNNYGSKKKGEEWWFNCVCNASGVIQTTDPSNPKLQVSIVDGGANDGNGDSGADLSGWNCMERWFMHAAYCNQQLRVMIDAGLVQGEASRPMTLDDITQANAQFFQISAITTDGEGNGFPNTLYGSKAYEPPYASPYITPTNVPTPGDCNYTMKALWNKWINQFTSLEQTAGTVPSWWSPAAKGTPGTPSDMIAPAARTYMPSTSFNLPCAMSMTTPGLLPNMSVGDLGSSDYDAVSAIMNEIYDTSDSPPFRMLGANLTPVASCPIAPPAPSTVSGAQFTAAVYTAANPTSKGATGAQYPETFAPAYGVWDNLVLPPVTCVTELGALSVVYSEAAGVNNCTLIRLPGTGGGQTTLDSSFFPVSPLMDTSVPGYTPWDHFPIGDPWLLQPRDAPLANTPPFRTGDPTGDGACLGWALEASRYDLYNGKWAADAATASGNLGTPIDYTAVVQGVNGVDGALLWSDLSTGLKCRVAKAMIGTTSSSITTPASAAGQVWMLSNQCGPWVNSLSVRASVRGRGTTYPITKQDLLTFSCPDSSLSTETMPAGAWQGWPGWYGMQNQVWGAFANTPNAIQTAFNAWSLDQAWLGENDPIALAAGVSTGSTEDNFGVFYDFNIQIAAWIAMALDLQGLGPVSPPQGISVNASVKYTAGTTGSTGLPKVGCYELAFMPLSWFGSIIKPPLD